MALAAFAFPFAASAQDAAVTPTPPPAEDAPTQLETIVIQASPFGLSADALVQPVDVLSGEDLEQRRRGTIGDVLADRPGIGNASFGPGVGRPVIRGQGGPRVQIMENGIGSMDASAISADHAVSVDPLGADQVEVIKGPATLIYGGAASAGVVNVVDDRLPTTVTPGLRLRGDVSYGDNADETNAAVRARYGVGEFQFGAQYARRDAGDFSIPGYAVREGLEDGHDHDHGDEAERHGVLENSRLTTESGGVSGAWVTDRGMLGAAVSRFDTNYGIAGHSHGHEEEEEEAHSHDGVRIDLQQTRVDLRGLLYDPLPGFDRVETRIGINDYRHREIEPGGEVGTTFDVRETEARVELAHKSLADWVGVSGLQFKHRDFEAVGEEAFVPPVVTRDVGVFLIEGRELGEHRLELGGRVDFVSHAPKNAAAPDRDYTPVTLSAGINFMLSEHLHLRVNAQRAQRAPAAEEVYAYGPHIATAGFERGSLSIDPETAHNLDIGFGRDDGAWTWEIGAFYNRIRDYIFLQEVDQGLNADGSGTPSSDGIADRVDESGQFATDGELLLLDFRQQDAEFYGAEVSGRLKLIDSDTYRLALRGFGDIVRAKLVDSGENLPRVTPMRLGISAEGGVGPWSATLGYTRVMEQDRTAPLETPTPGHDLVSADLGYALTVGGARVTLYARGRNLLDEKQRLATSFLKDISPQPGRSVFVGLRFDFDPAS
jgi:iron complex outermembrane receptor protein